MGTAVGVSVEAVETVVGGVELVSLLPKRVGAAVGEGEGGAEGGVGFVVRLGFGTLSDSPQ